MKAKPDRSWFHWSDGRAFTRTEWQRFRWVLARTKQPGESYQQRFRRVRAVIEEHKRGLATS